MPVAASRSSHGVASSRSKISRASTSKAPPPQTDLGHEPLGVLELRHRKIERHGELAEETGRTLEMTFRICWIARQPRLNRDECARSELWIPSGRKAVDGSEQLLGLGDVVQLQRGLDRNDECFLDVLDRDTHHVADAERNLGEAQRIGGIPTREKQLDFPQQTTPAPGGRRRSRIRANVSRIRLASSYDPRWT